MLTEYLYGWSKQWLVGSSGLGLGVGQSSLTLPASLSLLLKSTVVGRQQRSSATEHITDNTAAVHTCNKHTPLTRLHLALKQPSAQSLTDWGVTVT